MQHESSSLRQVQIIQKRQEAEGVCSFELACPYGEPLPCFTAGAHIDVHVNGFIRQYSLCSHPATTRHYRIGVLREPSSRGGSAAMHEALNEGDMLCISEPRNQFTLTEGNHHTILIAGGIGVTPLLSMAYYLQTLGASFELHYCSRTRERAAFFDELSTQPLAHNVFFHFDNGDAQQKLDLSSILQSAAPDSHWYVCGPTGFLDYVLNEGRAAGLPDSQLHREYFSGASKPQDAADTPSATAFEVVVASTGKAYTIESDESVTHGLLRQGIEIPVSCEQGVCGTCLTKVLEGIPEHHDLLLSPGEHAQNDLFTPCCSRSKTARLVLDL